MTSELNLAFMRWWKSVGRFQIKSASPAVELVNRERAFVAYQAGREQERAEQRMTQ